MELALEEIIDGSLNLINTDDFEKSGRTISRLHHMFKDKTDDELAEIEVIEDVPLYFTGIAIDMGRSIQGIAARAIQTATVDDDVDLSIEEKANILMRLIELKLRLEGIGKAYKEYRTQQKRTAVNNPIQQKGIKLGYLIKAKQELKI